MNPPKFRILKGYVSYPLPTRSLLSLWLLFCLTACNCRVFHQLSFRLATVGFFTN